jgi:Ni,Fe-hydrogenase I small subunit
MAITRRQFVTRLSALAAAAGMSQGHLTKLTEAFAYGSFGAGVKPKVLWIHGAECTGCSTSLLGLFEDLNGEAVVFGAFEGTTTGAALGLTGLELAETVPTHSADGADGDPTGSINIADVLIDVIDLQYHETVMGMGGDLAYQFLADQRANSGNASTNGGSPFVLVVEGACQPNDGGGAWNKTGTEADWCSIGMSDDGSTSRDGIEAEHGMAETVLDLANSEQCYAVIAIGQCATYGGYPGCESPIGGTTGAGFSTGSQTGALGVYDYLVAEDGEAGKVINVPGCPANPWWFILTVVAWLIDANAVLGGSDPVLGVLDAAGAPNAAALDSATARRLNLVFGTPIHGPACPRYQDFLQGNYASDPGGDGCLQLIGCKGPSTNSLCSQHGWNAMQPTNDDTWDDGMAAIQGNRGSFCITSGHPCMACTEPGYPDAFLPFIDR